MSGINFRQSLEIVEQAACAPGPGAKRAPIFQATRLALVAQADDAFGEASAVIILIDGGNNDGVAPTALQNLLLPRRAGRERREFLAPLCKRGEYAAHDGGIDSQVDRHRHGLRDLCRQREAGLNIYGDKRIRRIIDVTDQRPRDCRNAAKLFAFRADDCPMNDWRMLGHATVNLRVERLDDLRAALGPPSFCGSNFAAVVEHERIEVVGVHIGLRFVVVGMIRRSWVSHGSGAERGDVEKLQDALMVLVGSQLDDRGKDFARRLSRLGGSKSTRTKLQDEDGANCRCQPNRAKNSHGQPKEQEALHAKIREKNNPQGKTEQGPPTIGRRAMARKY